MKSELKNFVLKMLPFLIFKNSHNLNKKIRKNYCFLLSTELSWKATVKR